MTGHRPSVPRVFVGHRMVSGVRSWLHRTSPFALVTAAAAFVLSISGVIDAFTPSAGRLDNTWTAFWTLVSLVIAAVPLLVAERVLRPIAFTAAYVFVVVTCVQMALADESLASANNLVLYPMMCCYVGWFFRRRNARILVAVTFALSGAALLVNPYAGLATTWANLALASIFCLEAAGYLRSKLDHEIRTDPLTGALNRSGLEARIGQELERAARTDQPLVLVLLDLDNFKQVNDAHGHAAGDRMLIELVQSVRAEIRPYDIIARLGGDEFLILMPSISAQEARVFVDRLRPITGDTWSHGIAVGGPDDTAEGLMERADRDLYATKSARRTSAAPYRTSS